MKAAVYHGRGDVRVESVPDPTPASDELLLEVRRASICGTDVHEWAHGPHLIPLLSPNRNSGHQGPVVLGHEFVGRVVAIGPEARGFTIGDRVVSGAGVHCGLCEWCAAGRTNLCERYYTLGLQANGGLAEYVTTPARICRHVPERCTDDDAALAQPLAVAIHAVQRSAAAPGDSVVIVGTGGIGALIVAVAAAEGLAPLIAVDLDERRLACASKLGADVAIDAGSTDAAQAILDATDGAGAQIVFEVSGNETALATATASTRRGGRLIMVGLHTTPRALDLASLTTSEINIVSTVAHVCHSDLRRALELLDTREIAQAVIGQHVALDELVEHGFRPLADQAAMGKVVVQP